MGYDALTGATGRYLAISAVAGTVDFGIAFVLLHSGFSPAFSLAVSIAVAGIGQYFALEWWGFPGRRAAFSLRRLAQSGFAEAGTYVVRVGVLWGWRHAFPALDARDHFVGLAVAYGVAFFFGYLIRSRLVFKRSRETIRRWKEKRK